MTAYYNENNKFAADWLENLIGDGLLPPGEVDRRDIRDVSPRDLRGFTQCHFFAGIGVWPAAARAAGWPDRAPLWTGSCPCQPFSTTGKRGGFADERHLWPYWHWLIQECQPDAVFGEQVASKDGLSWFDLVAADLQGTGYAGTVQDICSASLGAPNIRQRLYFVAERMEVAKRSGLEGLGWHEHDAARWIERSLRSASEGSTVGRMADRDHEGSPHQPERAQSSVEGRSSIILRADAGADGRTRGGDDPERGAAGASERDGAPEADRAVRRSGATKGFWRDADWLWCRDQRWRPVEPGTFPLAARHPERMGEIAAYGNALNFQVATAFVVDYLTYRSVPRRFHGDVL